MNDLNPSQKLAARPCAGWFRACRGAASARSRSLLRLAGWLAMAMPLYAQNPPTYLFQIDSSAVFGAGFSPSFVALDRSNNVYVTDRGNDRIEKFDSKGNYLMQWGSYGTNNGQFNGPEGIAVDSSNNVYVADSGNDRIQEFDSNGNYLTQWGGDGINNGQFSYPYGIAVDRSNNVYVPDLGNNRIEKFDSNGNYLMQWGSYGTNNGQFSNPYGIAVDSSNNVYVADGNNRVEKFDSDGNYLTQWYIPGPLGIAVDISNNVYADANWSVEKFDSNGNYLTQWFMSAPQGIAVDSSGNFIYVVDPVNSRIQVFVNDTNIIPPFIEQQPTNQLVAAGINVTFSVGVMGPAPFFYQWNSDNVAVPGATNGTLTVTNVNLSASGNYSVRVTNSYGSVLSRNAVLSVLPALVTTQPAGGLSATGAVLNGSANVGVESLAWFEWGTDTNYGNITGAAVVPGNNASNSISAPVNGLSGNFYHYRMDAANGFGIVYGDDQSFTVGLAPSATTLPPTNGANGATLNAVVNPEGWDTTVYFRWGTPTLNNTTPGMDIGAGAASVNVSSFVSGLAASTSYKYQVVASNALGTALGGIAYGDGGHPYLFSGSKTNITLAAGTYIITAYGAPGGGALWGTMGGGGAGMSAEFNFSVSTTLTLLVGGGGGDGSGYSGGSGGGGSFVVEGSTPLVIAGGGGGGGGSRNGGIRGGRGTVSPNGVAGGFIGDAGGDGLGGAGGGGGAPHGHGGYNYSGGGFGGGGGGGGGAIAGGGGGGGGYSGGGGAGDENPGSHAGGGGGGGSIINSSAIAILAEGSRFYSQDDLYNGEIIITAVPTPLVITTQAAFGFTNGVFGFNVIGPSGSNVVIQASTDLQTWIPLQTNLLGTGPLYFSDPQPPANVRRFYRFQLSP